MLWAWVGLVLFPTLAVLFGVLLSSVLRLPSACPCGLDRCECE